MLLLTSCGDDRTATDDTSGADAADAATAEDAATPPTDVDTSPSDVDASPADVPPPLCTENNHVVGHHCSACADGSTRPAGDDPAGADTDCAPTACPADHAVMDHRCYRCMAGTTRPAGDLATGPYTLCTQSQRVSVGERHACRLTADGGVLCWGDNTFGQSLPPSAGTFVSVAVGGRHSCALQDDGAIACWGRNDRGQAAAPSGHFVSVTAGADHSCAVTDHGFVTCWGSDADHQFPPAVSHMADELSVTPAIQVVAHAHSTCTVRLADLTTGDHGFSNWTADEELRGRVDCYGSEFGNHVGAGTSGRQVALGQATCVLGADVEGAGNSDRSIRCSGVGSSQDAVIAGSYTEVWAGSGVCARRREDGTIACFAYPWNEAASEGDFEDLASSRSFSTSGGRACGVDEAGAARCVGTADHGLTVALAGSFERIWLSAVEPAGGYGCASRADGGLECFAPELDGGAFAPPTGAFEAASIGPGLGCAVSAAHAVTCWAQGTATVSEALPTTATEVATIGVETCWLDTDGKLACTPDSVAQALGASPPAGLSGLVLWSERVGWDGAVIDGSHHVLRFGDKVHGWATPGPDANLAGEYQQLSGSAGVLCGITMAGTIACSDAASDDATWPEPPTGSFERVSVGRGAACGITTAGAIACWGPSVADLGRSPSGAFRDVAVGWQASQSDAGVQFGDGGPYACAVRSTGELVCWGSLARDLRTGDLAPE